MIVFNAEDHSYKSVDDNKINWISVTTLVSYFKNAFDANAVAKKVSKNKRSKWFGLEPKIIKEIWSNEAKRATDLGSFYHDQREAD